MEEKENSTGGAEGPERPPVATLYGDDVWSPDDPNLRFHYNRERRLASAPKIVQDYYRDNSTLQPPRGIKIFVANKANRSVLFVLLLVFAVGMGLVLFGKKENADVIAGIRAELTAFRFQDEIYVSLALEPQKNGKIPPVKLEAEFSALNSDGQAEQAQGDSCFFDGASSFLRTTFKDYDIMKVAVRLDCGTDSVILQCPVQQR